MKAKVVCTVVRTGKRKVGHIVDPQSEGSTLCGLEWKGKLLEDWPAKVKKCVQCCTKLLQESAKKQADKTVKVKEVKGNETSGSDLKKHGVKVGDEWQSYKGDKFKVKEVRVAGRVRVEWHNSGYYKEEWIGDGSFYFFHKLLHREEAVKEVSDLKVYGIRNGDLWETDKGDRFRGIDYPFFYRLIERDGKVVKENEVKEDIFAEKVGDTWRLFKASWKKEASDLKVKEDVLVVKVGDIWRSDDGITVDVLAVDGGRFFCKYHSHSGNLDWMVVTEERRIFHQLVKRDGKDVMVKRVKPTYGMDLASYGIHQGDKWLDVDGHGFTVVAIESDGKGRILAVNIEDRPIGGLQNRIRLVQVSPDRFAYLVERDGKSMEGA